MTTAVAQFAEWAGKQPAGTRFLELGTKRSDPNFPTHHRVWNPVANWTFTDVEHGTDVDVVADAHDLHPFEDHQFDGLVAVSVWEHLARPWIAAEAIYRVLKMGGRAYVATHQSFPLHGYPNDYFRFSTDAMRVIFEDAGFEVMYADYAYPCTIVPPPEVTRWNPAAPCHLNVDVMLAK